MKLYIGGKSQGKLSYVMEKEGVKMQDIVNAEEASEEMCNNAKVIHHFHLYIRKLITNGADPLQSSLRLLENNPNVILVSDEVGYGIVPIDSKEREFRETVGRVLCEMAKMAVSVERIVCGLGMKLK